MPAAQQDMHTGPAYSHDRGITDCQSQQYARGTGRHRERGLEGDTGAAGYLYGTGTGAFTGHPGPIGTGNGG